MTLRNEVGPGGLPWRMLSFGNDHSLDQHHTVAAPMRFLSTCNLTTYIIVSCIPEVACKFCQLVLKYLPVLERDRTTHLSCRAFNKSFISQVTISALTENPWMVFKKGIVWQENAKVTLAPKER